MNKYQLEELKNLVEGLNLNNESDNLDAEVCDACCLFGGGGVNPPKKEEQVEELLDELERQL